MIKYCLTSDECQLGKATATLKWKNRKAIQSTRLRCQLDEQWFDLTKDTLRDALQITPVNDNQAFTSAPSSDALINFVNELGYPKLVRNLSNVRKHKFYPRPDFSLHLPNEEPVLRYLKFSAKRTKKEVFGMPIPASLITVDIQEASYYQEYLAKVAKYQRYLAGETWSDHDSPAPKPTKTARKPKPMAPKAPPRPSVSNSVSSTQPEPKSAPVKTQGKKRKLTTEISDKPSKAIKSRHGFLSKKLKPISTPKFVDESVAEDIPTKEPRVDDEEADVKKELEESIKSMYDVPRGPLPPVVIQEPESGKYQPLPEVPRKGSSGRDESSSLHAELGMTDNDKETEEDVLGADAGGQAEGQAGSNPDEQAEGKGQAGPDPGNAEESQPMPSLVVHAGLDREHMDLDVADVSPQLIVVSILTALTYCTSSIKYLDYFFIEQQHFALTVFT
uniref:Histone deacetylase 14 n=1 Tax=Tanacetum cinerariifolium TaxID=118510 RepID=A0A6L2NCV7_TANCI|nr:histone deacetylase 14 [Tanacetum cinerariifolium]